MCGYEQYAATKRTIQSYDGLPTNTSKGNFKSIARLATEGLGIPISVYGQRQRVGEVWVFENRAKR